MIYRPCTYRILENSVIVEFEDFVDNINRKINFYSGKFLQESRNLLYCSTELDDGKKVSFCTKYTLCNETSVEIHKALVLNQNDIKNQIISHFGYVWV